MSSLTLDKSALDRLAQIFESPVIAEQVSQFPQKKAIAALVAQAIADNFEKEGPGWAPLKGETIRASVSKKLKRLMAGLSSEDIQNIEKKRKSQNQEPHRKILQKTRLLMKTVTTVGYKGSVTSKGKNPKTISGANIWRTEGTNLIYGTDLIYAGIHNAGYPKRNIPKREFLVIRNEWMTQINRFIYDEIVKILQVHFKEVT